MVRNSDFCQQSQYRENGCLQAIARSSQKFEFESQIVRSLSFCVEYDRLD